MTTDNTPEQSDARDRGASSTDDPTDYWVEVKTRPTFVRPDIESDLDVAIRNADISLVRDGILHRWDERPYRPFTAVHERIKDAVEDQGYTLERYASVSISFPPTDSRLTTIEFTVKVTGKEP